jgi:hypothetical protein
MLTRNNICHENHFSQLHKECNCEKLNRKYILTPTRGRDGLTGRAGRDGSNIQQTLLFNHQGILFNQDFLDGTNTLFTYTIPVGAAGCYLIVTSVGIFNFSGSPINITYTLISSSIPTIQSNPNETTRSSTLQPSSNGVDSISTNGTYCFNEGDIITAQITSNDSILIIAATFDAVRITPSI